MTTEKTIWKYELSPIADAIVIRAPEDWHPMSVGVQRNIPISVGVQEDMLVLWAIVDPLALLEDHTILVRGTGHPLHEDDSLFIGTAQMPNGLVWHVFER